MRKKLLCLIAFTLLIGSTPAKASTYIYNVIFPFAGFIVTDCNECVLAASNFIAWDFGGISGGPSGVAVAGESPLSAHGGFIRFIPDPSHPGIIQFSEATSPAFIAFINAPNGASISYLTGPPFPHFPVQISIGEITIVANDTPLPAALPLFATGMGVLGLLHWRRKRPNIRPKLS